MSFDNGDTWEQIGALNITQIHSKPGLYPLIFSNGKINKKLSFTKSFILFYYLESNIVLSTDFGFTWEIILNKSYAFSFDNSLLIAGRKDEPTMELL